jgi:hypothetical protein
MLRRFSVLPIVLLVAFWPSAMLTAQQPAAPAAPTGAPAAAGPRGGGRGFSEVRLVPPLVTTKCGGIG